MNDLLIEIESRLKAMNGVKSASIGLETGISSKDTPALRIVQEYYEPEPKARFTYRGAFQILILLDLKNGARDMNLETNTLSIAIIDELKDIVLINRVDHDADSVTVFKSAILRFTFNGIKNKIDECN